MKAKKHLNLRIPLWWPSSPGWRRLARALTPHPGTLIVTLVVVAAILWAQSVGALPLRAPAAASTSTGTIAYQGRLADADGNPITNTVNMIFRLYDVATGVVSLWEEQWTGSNGVQVSDGLFNVMLGSLTSIPQSVITGHDSLFLGITVGTDDEMTPRVQLGTVPFAVQALTVPDGSITEDKLAPGLSLVPPGTIVMWSGSLVEIPDGWALCDGTNGTPDLRDRFILSVSAGEDPGGTGGSHTKTLSTSNLPPHSHSISSDGDHRHSYTDKYTTGERTSGTHAWDATYDKNPVYTTDSKNTEYAGGHNHGGNTGNTGSGSSFDIRPKYYKLAFIIKLP